MTYDEKVNSVFKDEVTRRAVKVMILDERLRNVALGWMHMPLEKRCEPSLYDEMIVREFRAKLLKN